MPMFWWDSLIAVRNSDLVNCHLPQIESVWLAIWAKILRKKLIVTHHCEFGFDGPISNKIIALISYPFHLFTYLMADRIVAYTKDYAYSSMFLKLFKNKLVFILPPIKIHNPSKSPFNKGDFKNQKIVGFVGRIAWEKGLGVLVEAMKGVKAKLVLVGPYDKVVGDKTYEKLKGVVKFYGPIDHDNLAAFYKACDCLVLPSTSNLETFGIVQAEAMVCACPVVASNLPGVRVPVKLTGMGEICEINNTDDLREKIQLVLKNGKKYYQNRAKNINLFDYKKTVDEYEKIF
jgi:glycosyltransferase involved in cell wall biosynthesis